MGVIIVACKLQGEPGSSFMYKKVARWKHRIEDVWTRLEIQREEV